MVSFPVTDDFLEARVQRLCSGTELNWTAGRHRKHYGGVVLPAVAAVQLRQQRPGGGTKTQASGHVLTGLDDGFGFTM